MNQNTLDEAKLHSTFLELKDKSIKDINEASDKFSKISTDKAEPWTKFYNAEIQFKNNNYSESKDIALHTLQNEKNQNLILAEANALLGRISRLYRLFDDAHEFFTKAELLFEKADDNYGTVRMNFNKANILLVNSQLEEALEAYTELLNKFTDESENESKTRKDSLKISVYQNIAITNLYLGKLEETGNNFKKARDLTKKLKIENTRALADLSLNYANYARTIEERKLLKELLQESYSIYKNLGNKELAAKVYIDLLRDELLFDLEIPQDPLLVDNLKSNYELAKGKEIDIRLEEIAGGLFELGEKEKAVEIVDFMLKKQLDLPVRGKLVYLLAKDQFLKENYKQSLRHCNEVIEISKMLNDDLSRISVESTTILAEYMDGKNLDLFQSRIKDNLKAKEKMEDDKGIGELLEQVYPLIAEESIERNDKFILELLEKFELPIVKKSKNKKVLKDVFINISIISFLYKEYEKTKKVVKKNNLTYDDIIENTHFLTYLKDENKLEEFKRLISG